MTSSEEAQELIERVNTDMAEAKDNLMLAKVFQADQVNRKCRLEDAFAVNDLVMLSTANRRKDYASTGSGRSVKLFPRHDGPYCVVEGFPQMSTYCLDILNALLNFCFMFHASQLRRYILNDRELFPGCEFPHDGPVMLANGCEEHVIERIINERKCGRGFQYLVRCKGYGPGDDEWLPRQEVEEMIALDEWLRGRSEGGCYVVGGRGGAFGSG